MASLPAVIRHLAFYLSVGFALRLVLYLSCFTSPKLRATDALFTDRARTGRVRLLLSIAGID